MVRGIVGSEGLPIPFTLGPWSIKGPCLSPSWMFRLIFVGSRHTATWQTDRPVSISNCVGSSGRLRRLLTQRSCCSMRYLDGWSWMITWGGNGNLERPQLSKKAMKEKKMFELSEVAEAWADLWNDSTSFCLKQTSCDGIGCLLVCCSVSVFVSWRHDAWFSFELLRRRWFLRSVRMSVGKCFDVLTHWWRNRGTRSEIDKFVRR